MKLKWPTLFISLAFLCIFMPSCRAPKDLVYRSFINLKVEKMGFEVTALTLDLIYYNPNKFGLQLGYANLDIYVNGNYLGHSTQDYQITIPKLAEFTLPLRLDLDLKNSLKNIIPTIFGKEVTVKITGKVKIGKGNIYKSFPVTYEENHKFSLF